MFYLFWHKNWHPGPLLSEASQLGPACTMCASGATKSPCLPLTDSKCVPLSSPHTLGLIYGCDFICFCSAPRSDLWKRFWQHVRENKQTSHTRGAVSLIWPHVSHLSLCPLWPQLLPVRSTQHRRERSDNWELRTENWELSAGEIEASESLRWTQSGLQIGNDKQLKLFGSNHIYFSHMLICSFCTN